jgi:signal transduction histidine kinase
MNLLQNFNRRTSIKTKGVIYVIALILVIFLTVSVLVMSVVKRNFTAQLDQFHQSIAEKLAQTASNVLLSRDYGFLMEQIRQLKSTGQVARVKIIDRRHVIVASDRLTEIGAQDAALTKFLTTPHSKVKAPTKPGTDILMSIRIGRDTLGALRVGFNWQAEDRRIDRELAQTIRQILYLALLIFVLGIGGAFIISGVLTRSIIELSVKIEQFDAELYPQEAGERLPDCRDETMQVRDAFTRMMANLRKYLAQKKKNAQEQQRLTCMATVGQMSAQIAHETRNSLYAIRGAISGLEKADSPAERHDYVEVIKDEVQEMTRMSDDFLQFARTPEPEIVPCHVDEVVQRIVDLLEPDLEEANIIVREQGEAMPPVLADPVLLKRAFMNLFLNAIQAMENGGTITVEYLLTGKYVEIRIKDDGPGIPEEINVNVFQPFFSTKINGTGLGLSTVYKLVMAQHGEVELEDAEHGACFMVQLPVAEAAGEKKDA